MLPSSNNKRSSNELATSDTPTIEKRAKLNSTVATIQTEIVQTIKTTKTTNSKCAKSDHDNDVDVDVDVNVDVDIIEGASDGQEGCDEEENNEDAKKKAIKKTYKQRYQQKKSIKRKLSRFYATTGDRAIVMFVTKNSQRKHGCDIEFFNPSAENNDFFNRYWADQKDVIEAYIHAYNSGYPMKTQQQMIDNAVQNTAGSSSNHAGTTTTTTTTDIGTMKNVTNISSTFDTTTVTSSLSSLSPLYHPHLEHIYDRPLPSVCYNNPYVNSYANLYANPLTNPLISPFQMNPFVASSPFFASKHLTNI